MGVSNESLCHDRYWNHDLLGHESSNGRGDGVCLGRVRVLCGGVRVLCDRVRALRHRVRALRGPNRGRRMFQLRLPGQL